MSKRPRWSWSIPWIVAVMALPAVYVAGYLPLAPDDPSTAGIIDRQFPNRWLAIAYMPMGVTEANVRGTEIRFHGASDHPSDPYVNWMISFEP